MNAGTTVAPVIVAGNDALNGDFPLRPFGIRHLLAGHPMIEPIWRGRLPIGDLVIPLKRNDAVVALTVAVLRVRAELRARLQTFVRALRMLKEKHQ